MVKPIQPQTSTQPPPPSRRRGRGFLRPLGASLAALAGALSIAAVPLTPQAARSHMIAGPEAVESRMAELRQTGDRWIQIDLGRQRLIAWEGGQPVYAVIVSTGKASTPTRPGVFAIHAKRHPERMRGPGYDIPNVPHAMYYHRGYAIHGAFWHSQFGTPVSHGCTNVAPDHARWLYNWAAIGTPVVVSP
jgi:lipoprotein-anchoring transpeptidase ErfK/SrfK